MEGTTGGGQARGRPRRVLKREAAVTIAIRRQRSAVAELYEKPLEELSPEEVKKMRAAFLFG
jgi:hypothetical protein